MQPKPPCSAYACWWWTGASGLLLHSEFQLGMWSVSFIYFFPPSYVALWNSKTPHRPVSEKVSWCLETSPLLWLPPWYGSLSLTLLSFFLSFIFWPTSLQTQWAAFLGAHCPPPVFRSSLWYLISVQMIFWCICRGESGLPVLFPCHLRTALVYIFFKKL